MKIGFIGTGLMGKPMIEKLVENNFQVNAYNRSIEKTNTLSAAGVQIYKSPEELIFASDVIIFMLTDFAAIKDVMKNVSNKKFFDKQFIQMGTSSPAENIELNNYFKNKHAKFIEAPVLGSIPQIKDKKLIVFIGSDDNHYRNYEKIFESFSNKIVYIGQIGKASALKLAINQLIVSELTIFSMSLKYVQSKDIDVEIFMDILRNSALYAPTFDKKLKNLLYNDFSNPNFPLKHMLKDLMLIINEFDKSNINTEILVKEEELLKFGVANGFADEDYSAVFKCLNKLNQLINNKE